MKMNCEICERNPAEYSFDAITEPDEFEEEEGLNFKVCVPCGNMLINSAEERDFWSYERL
jgi:protein-arginine kinase activator protein McsA